MAISFNGVSGNVTFSNTTSVTLSTPGTAQTGDLLIAVLGGTGASRTTVPSFTAPAGWTTVLTQTDATNFGGLTVFWAWGDATNFTWTTLQNTSGSGFILAYSAVDP